MRATLAALVLCSLLAGCASIAPPARDAIAYGDGREILVMLATPPVHYRPDGSYGAGYASSSARESRGRLADRVAADYGLARVDDWPMPALDVDCFVMQAAPGTDPANVVEALARDPRVESAQAVNTFHVLAHNDPLFAVQPSASAWHLADLHAIATGRNVRVAAIDSGVDAAHPDLDGQIALARDFVSAGASAAETHGTAVAGIIVARADNGIGIAGVAPDAKLVALRACWETAKATGEARCNSFTLAKALQFAIEKEVDVVNMSVGGPRDRLLARLLDVATARGITVVGAVDPELADGGFPASHRGVLAIAEREATSAPPNALLAPGRDIPTTTPGRAWGFVSGSSYAAAQASGLVALMREASPAMRPAEVLRTLLGESTSAQPAQASIDACDAVTRASGRCACRCAVAQDTRPQLPR